ncbi:MAG: hypothetical protein KGJ55_02810 [Gammaproteobacteria bacterium]|nr:hypothetical protein [Gammaproteobacteria bacterium]
MRGRIIQYDGGTGTGTIMAGGQQHRFTIDAWKSESVPTSGKMIDVAVDHGAVSAVTVVTGDVLLKEKAAELGVKLGSLAGRWSSRLSSTLSSAAATGGAGARGSKLADSVVERYGKLMPASYALFLLATLAFNAVTMSLLGQHLAWSFFDLSDYLSKMGQFGGDAGGGWIKTILILSYIDVFSPLLWRSRFAWLALALPLLAVLWALVAVLHVVDSVPKQFAAAGGLSQMFGVGFGFYLALGAALVLAAGGAAVFCNACDALRCVRGPFIRLSTATPS